MTTLKGIFPDIKTVKGKNFIHENIKNLRRIEHFNANKEIDEIHKLQAYNRKKINDNNINNHYHNQSIFSKPNSNFQGKKYDVNETNVTVNNKVNQSPELCKKSNVPVLNKNYALTKKVICSTNNNVLCKQKRKEHKVLHKSQKLHEKISSDPNLSYKSLDDIIDSTKIKVKSQGIQTLDTGDIDDLYSEGIIKYPSKKTIDYNEVTNKNETNEQIHVSSRNVTSQPSDRGDIQDIEQKSQSKNNTKNCKLFPSKEEIDFIKLNKERIFTVNKTAPQTNNNNNVSLPNYRMGVVPKYIKTRKEIQEKTLKVKEEELDPNCPSGHVPLPDCERKEALRMLRKNYQDYVNELNVMVLKVDTLRAQRRKIEIEKQLVKLEEGIKVFSRPKVYVKMNA